MSKTLSAGRTPKILIEELGGDLSLVGWESDEILLKGEEGKMRVQQTGEEVKISTGDDLSLRTPKGAAIQIGKIKGDASIRGLNGRIELAEIEGDLSLRDVGSVSIGAIHSDLSLRSVRGAVSVKSALSDVSIREVEGDVSLESVSDDLALRDVRGNVNANVSEDVILYIVPLPGKTYAIHAGKDILLVMPPSANATLTLNADSIDVDWKGVEREQNATSRVVTLGDGSAAVSLRAGGDIRVSYQSAAGDSAEEFGNFAGVGFDWSDFGERISRQVERATRRAARHVEETARRLERRGSKIKMGAGRWNWDFLQKGMPPEYRPKASDEERLTVLKMLQEKKITSEEADALLTALEGES
jgi:hypothetical protein